MGGHSDFPLLSDPGADRVRRRQAGVITKYFFVHSYFIFNILSLPI